SRDYVNATVLGVLGNRVYGFNPPEFVFSNDFGNTWQGTGVLLQDIYSQLGFDWNDDNPPSPLQMLFQSVPPNRIYVATSDAHLIANPDRTKPFPSGGWLDLTPPTPTIPDSTTTVGRCTSATVNGGVLLYGCYNQDPFTDMQPYSCANFYRYDCNTSGPWVLVLTVPGARHIHANEVDPQDPRKIYVVVGDGGTHGLWYSADGGLSFQHLSG